jgi:predicted TIM-barrel fold metal-dependent hydrolase
MAFHTALFAMRISPILGADAALKAQKQFPNLRGVRQILYWDSDTIRHAAPRPNFCNSPDFRRGFALLEKQDLHFELQVYTGQAAYAVELIKSFPNVRMILVHAGMLTCARRQQSNNGAPLSQ